MTTQPSDLRLLVPERGGRIRNDLIKRGRDRSPAEFLADAGRVCREAGGLRCGWDVSAGNGSFGDGLHGVNDVVDGAGVAAADVVGAPSAGLAGVECADEGVGHVGDVDEVAHGTAVAVDGD